MKLRDRNGKFIRTVADRRCSTCSALFYNPQKKATYCSRDCYYQMKRLRGDRVNWTPDMRTALSDKYKGDNNPAHGKPAWSRGKKRPEITGAKHPKFKGGWM